MPSEFRIYAEAYEESQKEKYKLAIYQAYQAETFSRQKAIKPLSDYLKKFDKPIKKIKKEIPNDIKELAKQKGLKGV